MADPMFIRNLDAAGYEIKRFGGGKRYGVQLPDGGPENVSSDVIDLAREEGYVVHRINTAVEYVEFRRETATGPTDPNGGWL